MKDVCLSQIDKKQNKFGTLNSGVETNIGQHKNLWLFFRDYLPLLENDELSRYLTPGRAISL